MLLLLFLGIFLVLVVVGILIKNSKDTERGRAPLDSDILNKDEKKKNLK